MTRWKKWCLGLAVAAGATEGVWAQAPVVPAAAPAVVVPAAGPAMVPGAPGIEALPPAVPGGMCGNIIQGCDYITFRMKLFWCNSVLGQLFNNMLKPANALTGGVVPLCCPPLGVNPADLLKPADSAEGAAARIKADTADAKARAAALRYLGTVDCHYWPEAQAALINGLRADRNECVRLAAALALGSGCCCSPKTITALGITVAGTEDDGNPSETSERVRAAAFVALSHCVDRFPPPPVEIGPVREPVPGTGEPVPPPRVGPETVPPPKPMLPPPPNGSQGSNKPADKTKVSPAAYYERVAKLPMSEVLDRARRQLHDNAVVSAPAGTPHPSMSAGQGILGMALSAMTDPAPAAAATSSAPPAMEVAGDAKAASTPVAPPSEGTLTPVNPGRAHPAALVPVPAGQTLPIVPSASHGAPPTGPVVPPRPTVPVSQPSGPMPQAGLVTPPRPVAPVVWTSPYASQAPAGGQPSGPSPVVPAVALAGSSGGSPPPPRLPAPPPLPVTPVPAAHTTPPASSMHAETAADSQPARWVAVLRAAPDAEARGWAASRLQGVDWHAHPEVVTALLSAAVRDRAPSVRTGCIRTLNVIDANTSNVLAILDSLRSDSDPAVKQAADEALREMTARRRQ
jgi:hypothetical protein